MWSHHQVWRHPIALAIHCNGWDVFVNRLAKNSKLCSSFLVPGILFHSRWCLLGALSLCLISIYFVYILSPLPAPFRGLLPRYLQLYILSKKKKKSQTSTKQKQKQKRKEKKKIKAKQEQIWNLFCVGNSS